MTTHCLCQWIIMIIWLTCDMEQAPCPPLHLLVPVHLVAVAERWWQWQSDGGSGSGSDSDGSCSEQVNDIETLN